MTTSADADPDSAEFLARPHQNESRDVAHHDESRAATTDHHQPAFAFVHGHRRWIRCERWEHPR